MENTYTIVGLFCNFFGACCLAYELLWGYPRSNRKAIAETKLAGLYQFFEEMDRMIDRYKEPPYTPEEKDQEKQEVRKEMAENVRALEAEIHACGEGHGERAFYIGLLGAVLLSTGFVLQLIDLI